MKTNFLYLVIIAGFISLQANAQTSVASGNDWLTTGKANGSLAGGTIKVGGATTTKGGNIEITSGNGGTSQAGDVILTAASAQNKGGDIILTPGIAASGSGRIVFNMQSNGMSINNITLGEKAKFDCFGALYSPKLVDYNNNTYFLAPSNTAKSLSIAGNINDKIFFKNGFVGIGTSNPTAMLTVKGKIEAEEIEVKNIAADFVFAKDYKLTPLTEVEAFINENGHLPGVASAEETAKGVELGKFNTLLLQKVEELTLYMIELKKENELLKAEVSSLK